MKIRQIKSKKLRAFLAIGGILTILGAGSILFKNAIGAFAQDGDFVTDVQSFLSIRQQQDGSEKVSFLSGEIIEYDSRIEINGKNSFYDDSYVIYKIPNKYLDNSRIVAPDTHSEVSSYNEGEYKIYKVKFNKLSGGSIAGVLLGINLDRMNTPLGYNLNITQEYYSKDGLLLSKKSKTINTTKHRKGLGSVRKGVWNGQRYSYEKIKVPSVTYSDSSNRSIDSNSWSVLGAVRYEIYYSAEEHTMPHGRNSIKQYKVTDFLPEHMELSQESIDAGWAYDSSNHSASIVTPANSQFQLMSEGRINISLHFKNGTPESIINTDVINRVNVEIEYSDGDKFNNSAEAVIIPVAVKKSSGEIFSFKKIGKGDLWRNDHKWLPNGKGAMYHIDTLSELTWDINVSINNQYADTINMGDIIDEIPEYLKVSRAYINNNSRYKFSSDNPIELYSRSSNNIDDEKIADLYGDKVGNFTGNEDIRSLRFSVKSGKIPGYIQGGSEYSIILSIVTKIDKEYFNKLIKEFDTPYAVINTAEMHTEYGNISSSGTVYLGRWGLKLDNNIGLNSKPYYGNGASYKSQDILTTGFTHWWNIGRGAYAIMNINDVRGAKVIYLFPQNMEFTDSAKDRIRSGSWKYVHNFKSTGKSAIIQESNFSNVDFLRVGRLIPSGTYEVEKITIWDKDSSDYGNGPDDLDFHDDGDTSSRQVARSKGNFVVDNPLLVGTLKQIRSLEKEDFFSNEAKIKPGNRIEYSMSIINYNPRALTGSRSLEILPYSGDRLIVRDNNGILGGRGSKIPVKMTGPVVDVSGKFDIFYSTDTPGSNEDESYSKNFISANQVTDWSSVRMIKFEQKADQEITPQSTVSLIFPAKVDENAPDQSVAFNTFATGLSGTSKLNEGNAAKLTVIHDAKVRGIAFEDMNSNGVFDQGVDTLLSGYKAKLMKGDQVVAEKITGDNGEYEILTDKFADGYKIQFEKPDGDIRNVVESQVNNGFENSNSSNLENKQTLDSFTFNLRENGEKEVVRNIGLFTPRGSVRVKFQTIDGVELKADQIPFENRPVGEEYSTEFLRNQNSELADANGLRYQFSKRKEDSAQETGLIELGEKTVVYQYEPMAGSIVTIKYVIQGTQIELAPQVVVKPQGAQVGTPYSAPYEKELIDANGLVYDRPTFSRGSGPNGRVSVNPINLVVSYRPKMGGLVKYNYKTEDGEEILAPTELNLLSQQIGAKYSHTPDLEVEHKGITYVLKGLKDGSAPQNGAIKTEDQLITYVFVPKKGGQVVANYFDEEGNSISNTSIVSVTNTPVGTDYRNIPPTEIITADGLKFTYKELGTNSAPQNGKVKSETQEIRYIYAKKLGKGVISKFVDEDGNEISPDVEVVADGAQVGTRYSAAHQNEITKDNLVFEFKEIAQNSAPENGKITEDSQVVTFVYRKKLGGKVTAKFVDLDGNELKDPVEVAPEGQQVGTEYSSTKENEITKDGLVYVFEVLAQNSAPEKGRIKSGAQEVIYAYAPKKGGSVTAKFLDKNGAEIQISEVIKPHGTQVGTPYESTSKNKIVINGKTYILREVKGEQTGKVSNGDIVIQYIFELEENPAAILAPNTGFMAGVGGLLAVIAVSIASLFTLKKNSRI